jgi:acetyl esterase/lipase
MSESFPSSAFRTHAVTPRDRSVMDAMHAAMRPHKGALRGAAGRPMFDAVMSGVAAPQDVSFRDAVVGGVPGSWCEPTNGLPGAVILHAHGGWFTLGSAIAFRHLVGHIARAAGVSAFIPDYRLAPEHPFPAALEDLERCHAGLRAAGFGAIALSGDSAGGNLALVLSALLAGRHPPVALVAVSPVTDLALQGQSWESRAEADPLFVRDQAESFVRGYLGDHDPLDPRASPLYGDLAHAPPLRVHVGNDEVLLDDALRYVDRAVAAGVDAQVDVWEGMPHGFLGSVGRLEASDRAVRAIGDFLAAQFAAA